MIRDLGLNSNTSWRCHGHIVKPHLRKANDRISTKLTSIWEYIWPLSLLFTKTSYTTLYPRFCVSNQIRNHQKISNMSECWLNIYYIKILIGLFKIFQNIVIPGVLWWWWWCDGILTILIETKIRRQWKLNQHGEASICDYLYLSIMPLIK